MADEDIEGDETGVDQEGSCWTPSDKGIDNRAR
jgi:hypothetical protein